MYDTRDEVLESIGSAISAKKLVEFIICWMSEKEMKDFLRRNDLEHLAPMNME